MPFATDRVGTGRGGGRQVSAGRARDGAARRARRRAGVARHVVAGERLRPPERVTPTKPTVTVRRPPTRSHRSGAPSVVTAAVALPVTVVVQNAAATTAYAHTSDHSSRDTDQRPDAPTRARTRARCRLRSARRWCSRRRCVRRQCSWRRSCGVHRHAREGQRERRALARVLVDRRQVDELDRQVDPIVVRPPIRRWRVGAVAEPRHPDPRRQAASGGGVPDPDVERGGGRRGTRWGCGPTTVSVRRMPRRSGASSVEVSTRAMPWGRTGRIGRRPRRRRSVRLRGGCAGAGLEPARARSGPGLVVRARYVVRSRARSSGSSRERRVDRCGSGADGVPAPCRLAALRRGRSRRRGSPVKPSTPIASSERRPPRRRRTRTHGAATGGRPRPGCGSSRERVLSLLRCAAPHASALLRWVACSWSGGARWVVRSSVVRSCSASLRAGCLPPTVTLGGVRVWSAAPPADPGVDPDPPTIGSSVVRMREHAISGGERERQVRVLAGVLVRAGVRHRDGADGDVSWSCRTSMLSPSTARGEDEVVGVAAGGGGRDRRGQRGDAEGHHRSELTIVATMSSAGPPGYRPVMVLVCVTVTVDAGADRRPSPCRNPWSSSKRRRRRHRPGPPRSWRR